MRADGSNLTSVLILRTYLHFHLVGRCYFSPAVRSGGVFLHHISASNRLSAVFGLRPTIAQHALFYAQTGLPEHILMAKPVDEVPALRPLKCPKTANSFSVSLKPVDYLKPVHRFPSAGTENACATCE